MSVEEKIAKAKSRLVLKHPYFGMLALRLKSEPGDVEAFLSDGRTLQYNEEYFEKEPVETLEFAFANSVMHHVLAHENRRMSRLGWLWQLATDYAINSMLKSNGFEIPARVNYEERFEGMYAEEIYALLKDEIRNEDYSDDESNEEGFNEQNRDRMKESPPAENGSRKDENMPLPPAELQPDLQEEWARAMKDALDRAEEQGERPLGVERLFAHDGEAATDWRSELYQAVNRHMRSDYTFSRPNKKVLSAGIYLPSTCSEALNIAVAIDSSGSVDEKLLGLFVSELEAILLSFPDVCVDLIICDAKIQGIYRFVSGEILDFSVKGGGGTDFRPVFDYIEAELPQTSLLIYFTDAKGSFPQEEPSFDTVWAVPEESDLPFGRSVVLGGVNGNSGKNG
ncbi:Sll7028 protein [Hydrogenimonas sp.]|nr:Sll7028 protein [Hydrogenimonas sp.]